MHKHSEFKNHIREELIKSLHLQHHPTTTSGGDGGAILEWKEKWFDDLASDYGNLLFSTENSDDEQLMKYVKHHCDNKNSMNDTMLNCLFDGILLSKKEMLEQIANLQVEESTDVEFIDLLIDNSDVENEFKKKQDLAFELIIKQYLNGMIEKLYSQMKNCIQLMDDDEECKLQLDMKRELIENLSEFLQLSLDGKDVELLMEPILDSLFTNNGKSKEEECLTHFLTIIPFLEAGLRDCVLVHDFHCNIDKKKQESILNRLSTFSDILGSEDALRIYGPDISFVLRMCYGSQNTLNLRNISMHGYFSSETFHTKHLWFLLLVMSNLANHIRNQLLTCKGKITNQKEQAQFDEMLKSRRLDGLKKYSSECGISESSVASLALPSSSPFKSPNSSSSSSSSLIDKLKKVENIDKIAGRTFLFAHDRHEEWLSILKWYLSIEDDEDQQQQLEMFKLLSKLFPFFENLLRRLFIYSNLELDLFKERCRMIKVERGRSLVVFDAILNNRPNEYYQITTNSIFEEFSEGLINCIYDLFKWPQGVRIRTLMAHGCVHWNWIPKNYLDRLILLILYVMNQFSVQPPVTKHRSNNESEEGNLIETEILDEIYHFHLNYTPLFHPRRILANEIEKAIGDLERMEQFYTTSDYSKMKELAEETVSSSEAILEENTKQALLHKIDGINSLIGITLLGEDSEEVEYTPLRMAQIFKPIIQRIRYGVDEISEKEFKVLLLANRMTSEISSIINTQLNGLTSKWNKLSKLSSSQKSSFINAVNYTEMIHQVCEYCLSVQIGILTCVNKAEQFIAGCDRFCSQFQSSLPKNHLSKSIEILVAFVLGSEEASQCGYTYVNIKNKTLLKSLYHSQQK